MIQRTRCPRIAILAFLAVVIPNTVTGQTLPTDESAVVKHLTDKGFTIKLDAQGHAVRLTSSGKPVVGADEYQLIGQLIHLEQMGLNAAPLGEDEWGFLHSLPKLKTLSIWHGKGFATLEPFSGLPVESLTIGGCMGLRDLNKNAPVKLRDAITTLHDLPNLTHGNWYHSPLIPDDSHLAHIAKEFPKLENLRLDFKAPRRMETTITPAGLAELQRLPLRILNLENAGDFDASHMQAIAGIKSLQFLLIDARKNPAPKNAIEALKNSRPDIEVIVAGKDAKGPPQVPRK